MGARQRFRIRQLVVLTARRIPFADTASRPSKPLLPRTGVVLLVSVVLGAATMGNLRYLTSINRVVPLVASLLWVMMTVMVLLRR